jgi:glycosyltransferase involved in cell wall biosynthesis
MCEYVYNIIVQISLVITFLNEESTIDWLLKGIANQTTLPAEIILVDGGSIDHTKKIIKRWQKNKAFAKKIKLLTKKGNRSAGRNFGMSFAKHSWIAITDAGCIPHPEWLEELVKTQQKTKAKVIAGYYAGLPQTRFQQAVIPYALVMPDKVRPTKFLPASRSMLINKKVWQTVGKFDENLSHNEDYALAKKIERQNIPIAFAGQAIVYWLPRKNLLEFWRMIYRFALGDIQAGIVRPKVILVFGRYLSFLGLLVWAVSQGELTTTGLFFPSLILLYLIWAIFKNKRYTPQSWWWLPILQVTADWAVIQGSLIGWRKKFNQSTA